MHFCSLLLNGVLLSRREEKCIAVVEEVQPEGFNSESEETQIWGWVLRLMLHCHIAVPAATQPCHTRHILPSLGVLG